jgi:hypothetical protein
MARRPKTLPKVDLPIRAESPVRVVELESRRLVTISPAHEYWTAKRIEPITGAIYRVKPPAQVTDDDVAELVSKLQQAGVISWNVLPRESAPAIVARAAAKKASTARQVVRSMVAEARSSDPEALSAACESIMQEVGLQ